MKKSKIRIFTAMLMTVLCMTAFSATAYSGGGEDYTDPEPEQMRTIMPMSRLTRNRMTAARKGRTI